MIYRSTVKLNPDITFGLLLLCFIQTCDFSSFSCGLTAGVEIFLLTVPKALRPDGRGVVKVLAIIGDFKSFSGGGGGKKMLMHISTQTNINVV